MRFFDKNWHIAFVAGVFILLIAVGGAILLASSQNPTFPSEQSFQAKISQNKENYCPSLKKEGKVVRGNSLTGVLEDGETVEVLLGYYDCYEVQREDIVLYNYKGNENPIIKIIKGMPGDKLHLEKKDSGWNILINNEILKNNQEEPYLLSEQRHKLLSLYEKDYNGMIPEGAYLILGNLPSGSTDSTQFGLITKTNILGKVVLNNN